MPVTAKLSRKFYETLGDDVANELVEWFNQVDATYRADLRDLNELNFARFDAKVEQRFAESDAKLERRFAELEARFAAFETKWEARFAGFEVKWTKEFADLREQIVRQLGRIDAQQSDLKAELHATQLTQTRWFVGLWAAIGLAILGLYLR